MQCKVLQFQHKKTASIAVGIPGEKPQRIFEDLQGSLKICKDLQKIFEDEDLSRILKGSLKDL